MKKIVLFIFLFSALGFGQGGVRYTTQVQDISGRRVAFPVARFCSEPASGIVCTPLALTGIFSDINLTQPLANPFTGDQQGNIAFYAAPGRYHAQISGNGIVPYDIPDIPLLDTTQNTGTGLYVLQNSPTINSPTLVTPTIGVAIGTSLNLGGTGVLSTTAQSGTGSLCMTVSCVMTTPNIGAATGTSVNLSGSAVIGTTLNVTGTSTLAAVNSGAIAATSGVPLQALSGSSSNMQINLGRAATEVNFAVPQANGFFFTNSDLAAGDFVIRQTTAGRKIYLGTGASGASIAVTNAGLNFYTTSGTLPASITNDTTGGLNFVPSGGAGWEIVSDGRLFSLPGKTINLEGATSGIITLLVPSVAGSNSLTFPAATGTLSCNSCTQTLTATTLTSPIINTGIFQGSGFKHQRFGATNATPAGAGATSVTTYTWTSAFTDANYTLSCTGNTQSNTPAGVAIEGKTAANFIVRVTAITAAASSFAGVDCIGIHDSP